MSDHYMRLAPSEVAQLDAALDAEPTVNESLAQLVRYVRGDMDEHRMQILLATLDIAVALEMMRLRDATPDQMAYVIAQDSERLSHLSTTPNFRSESTGKDTAALARVLAHIALTSDGGVTFLGRHWCTDHARCMEARQ